MIEEEVTLQMIYNHPVRHV